MDVGAVDAPHLVDRHQAEVVGEPVVRAEGGRAVVDPVEDAEERPEALVLLREGLGARSVARMNGREHELSMNVHMKRHLDLTACHALKKKKNIPWF